MTNTTTTTPARFIPAAGLTATVADTTVTAFWVNGAGWKVQTRRDGYTTYSNTHRHEHDAVAEFNTLVAKAEAEKPAPAEASAIKLPAAAFVSGSSRMALSRATRATSSASRSAASLATLALWRFSACCTATAVGCSGSLTWQACPTPIGTTRPMVTVIRSVGSDVIMRN